MARRGKRTVVRAAMGLLSVLVGALLALRPFSAHDLVVGAVVVGLVVWAAAEAVQASPQAPARWLLGGLCVAAAIIVVAVPVASSALIGAVVGMLMAAAGVLEIWSGVFARTQLPRFLVGASTGGITVTVVSGASTLLLGAVAALWADPVVLPMLMAFGARLILVGAGLLVDLWYPPTEFGASTESRRLIWRVTGIVLALVLSGVGLITGNGPSWPSSFYYRDLAPNAPAGALLRAENYHAQSFDNASGVLLLYSTIDASGAATAASAVLFVPGSTEGATAPLVVWMHDDVGTGQACAPSVVGESRGGMGVLPQLLASGYAVLLPDGPALGAPAAPSYLVGQSEATSVLDAIRAAGQVPGLRLGTAVLWGAGAGGHAALWAGQLASTYAPQVPIAGVVVDAPMADPAAVLAADVRREGGSPLSARVLASYAANYADVDLGGYLAPPDQLLVQEVAARCGGPGWFADALARLGGANGAWLAEPTSGSLGARLAENVPTRLAVPLLVTQGSDDTVVPAALTKRIVDQRCRSHQVVDYRVYSNLGHRSPADVGAPQYVQTMSWIAQRFAGEAAPDSCSAGR